MKLVSSTGDFAYYVPTTAEEIKAFKGTGFKYLNLEQSGSNPEFFTNNDDYKKLADDWGNAAAEIGCEFVVSHAPCLHRGCP